MRWTKEDRAKTCMSVIECFLAEFKEILEFAQREGIDHNELWMGYLEQRKDIER